jgi:nucleotide-binding universal stress UspA family protein
MFETILVAVDGSEGALAALELAVELQKKCDSKLLLLCVYRHHSLLEGSMSMVRPDNPENMDDSLREFSSGVVEQAKAFAAERGSREVRGFVKIGPPARTIVGFAKEREAKLIVLGSRGLGDIEGFLLGSVSHKVTSLAECPVMVV